MATEETDSTVLSSTAVWSVAADQRAGRPLLVLFHGHGGVEDDLTPIFPLLPASTVAVAFRGIVPLGNRWTWFDVEHQPRVVFDHSVRAVMRWIDQACPVDPVGLLGFSQGGAVALDLLRLAPRRFAYVGQMSGFIMDGRRGASTELARRRPPAFSAHGGRDEVIPSRDVRATSAWLRRHTDVAEYHYPDLDHRIADDVLLDAAAFIERVQTT